MLETFDERRIKSIIEYNLRKYRINSIEYKVNYCTDDPTGIRGMVSDDSKFKSWEQKPVEHTVGVNEKKYNIRETNHQLRDFLTKVIIDIFCGAESDGSYSKANERVYNVKPSVGKSVPIEDAPFVIKRGDTEFKVSKDGVFVNEKKI